MPLNARQVETAKPRDKAYKLADGGGLYLMETVKEGCIDHRFRERCQQVTGFD